MPEDITTQILISIRDELRGIRSEHGELLKEQGRKLSEHTGRLEALQEAISGLRGEMKIGNAQQAASLDARLALVEEDVEKLKRMVG